MVFIVPHVHLVAQSVPRSSPISNLVLVVSVEGARIKNKGLSGVHIRGSVFVPKVSVDKARFDASTVRLQRLQKPGDDDIEDKITYSRELRPFAMFLTVQADHVLKLLSIEDGPTILPAAGCLRQLGMAGRDVKAKLARWGLGLLVQLCDPGRELDRVRWLLAYLTKIGQQEIAV